MNNIISFPKLGLEFNINRSAFSVFGIDVYWYGLIIGLGLILAFFYALRESNKAELRQDDVLNMFLFAVPISIICARAYYVIFSFEYYKDDLWQIFNIRNGGIAIYGAVIGAVSTVLIYCKHKKISMGKVFDILAIGLLIGQAIGRWGNFVNGEAFGVTTTLPWAMSVTSDGAKVANLVHPTFLYESLWNTLGICLLLIYKKHKKFDGEIFSAYLAWYGLGRFWIEGLRSDSLYLLNFRVSQLVALMSVIAGIVLIISNRKKNK